MPEADRAMQPDSFGGWAFPPLSLLGIPALNTPGIIDQPTRTSLMALDFFESWLTASRQMTDVWRTSVRHLQDGALATCRRQMSLSAASAPPASGITGEAIPAPAEASMEKPARRAPLTRTAVTKNSSS